MFRQLCLGSLIKFLKTLDPEMRVKHGFRDANSYRGTYSEIGFEYAQNITVLEMLKTAEDCIDRTFEGWKGGEYEMHEGTDVWLVNSWGETGQSISEFLLRLMFEMEISI
jgi:hypothetical protein